VDAPQLGMDGGCAYFVDKRLLCLYGSKLPLSGIASNSCDKSEFVERLSDDDWNNDGYMWNTPQPAISLQLR